MHANTINRMDDILSVSLLWSFKTIPEKNTREVVLDLETINS